MSLLKRWKAPTPKFFKNIIRLSLTTAAGAGAAIMVEPLGKMAIPDFTFTLNHWVELICKNLVACGIVSAAIAKFAKIDTPVSPPYKAPEDKEQQNQ